MVSSYVGHASWQPRHGTRGVTVTRQELVVR
jgi:hypothetical protein